MLGVALDVARLALALGEGGGAGTEPAEPAEVTAAEDAPVDVEWEESYETSTGSGKSAQDEEELYEYRQANLTAERSLREYLLWQAELAPFDDTTGDIALHLIDAINDDGYLEDWPGLCERLKATLGADVPQIEAVLKLVQDFDPAGVGARDLSECLALQLRAGARCEAQMAIRCSARPVCSRRRTGSPRSRSPSHGARRCRRARASTCTPADARARIRCRTWRRWPPC